MCAYNIYIFFYRSACLRSAFVISFTPQFVLIWVYFWDISTIMQFGNNIGSSTHCFYGQQLVIQSNQIKQIMYVD